MNALEVTLETINKLQAGVEHYNNQIPHYQSEENKVKWSTYVQMIESKLSEEKSVAIGLIDVKISQIQQRLHGAIQVHEKAKLTMLREQITNAYEIEPVVLVC